MRLLILSLVWWLDGCNAPRDNPLDPQSSLYHAPEAPARISDLTLAEQDGKPHPPFLDRSCWRF
jgi:hypothetical protein